MSFGDERHVELILEIHSQRHQGKLAGIFHGIFHQNIGSLSFFWRIHPDSAMQHYHHSTLHFVMPESPY